MNRPNNGRIKTAAKFTSHFNSLLRFAALLSCAALASCGGGGSGGGGTVNTGGGGNQATLVVTPTSLSVTAPVNGTAPTATIQVSIQVTNNTSAQFYVDAKYTDSGISSLSAAVDGSVLTITATFKDPSTLGQGTYTDDITVSACYQEACTQQVSASPQSVNVTYEVTAEAPFINSLSPSSVIVGAPAFTLTVNGSDFTSDSLVEWNGTALATTFVSSTELQAPITAADVANAGPQQVQVSTDGASANAVNFTVQPFGTTQISSISPSSVVAESGAFTMTVNGSNFTTDSFVQFDSARRITTFVSSTQLTAQIFAPDVQSPGAHSITVWDANIISNAATLTIQSLPSFALSGVSPTLVYAGGPAFYVTSFGNGFTGQSTVTWNGVSLPTTYVSATTLRAAVTAAQIASAGSASLAVSNSGSTSPAQTLTIAPQSIDAMSFQMNPAHTGSVTFKNASLPAASLWSVTFSGPASYALIAGGLVFVTVADGQNSDIYALNATTGATVWGPIQVAGYADAAYEGGTLFVVNGTGVTLQVLTAYNAITGAVLWTNNVPGEWFPTAPVASGGFVYTQNGEIVSAFSEAYGVLTWTGTASGTSGSMAVTADAVYGPAVGTTTALQPALGTTLWTNNPGGEGGGGSTPVIAGNILFSALNASYYSGETFNAETGAVLASFSQYSMPAVNATTAYSIVQYTNSRALQAVGLSGNQQLWTFAGDGAIYGPPIIVNNWVFTGSTNGNLYAVDATSGSQVWKQNLGAMIQLSVDDAGTIQNYGGLTAGDGLLLVPSGNSVTAYQLSTNP